MIGMQDIQMAQAGGNRRSSISELDDAFYYFT